MKVLGLTGGIGMGKSTAERMLRERGLPVADTDVIARALVEPGQPALGEIRTRFGAHVIDAEGKLQRHELATIVFSDLKARKTLEEILHPRIRAVWKAQVDQWRQQQMPACVVVIPLLFETGAEADVDRTVCVACSTATQRDRLRNRGWSDEQIVQRIAAQWPIEQKMAKADHVVWTEGTLDVLASQLARIF